MFGECNQKEKTLVLMSQRNCSRITCFTLVMLPRHTHTHTAARAGQSVLISRRRLIESPVSPNEQLIKLRLPEPAEINAE